MNEDLWDGKRYSEQAQVELRQVEKALAHLQLAGTERIIDLGCGDGKPTALVARRLSTGSIMGIDASPSMLAHAPQIPRVEFRLGDVERLPFKAEFDLALSFCCFHWLTDVGAAMQGIGRALKSGGRLFSYYLPDYRTAYHDLIIEQLTRSADWQPYLCQYINPLQIHPTARIIAEAERAGFTHITIRPQPFTVSFPSRVEAATWITSWLHPLRCLPEKLHQPFLNALLDAMPTLDFREEWVIVEAKRG